MTRRIALLRQQQRRAIAADVRLHSRARHTQAALIDDVMLYCGVSRNNARVMISRARKGNRNEQRT
jgi:predicted transcriptional regulator of viral defense system